MNSVWENMHGGCYQHRASYSAARISECVDSYHFFGCSHSRELNEKKFMQIAKIGGKDIACRVIHNLKLGL